MQHPAPTDIELGTPYIAGREAWEPGAELAVLTRGAVLRLFEPDPPDARFEAVVVGRVELRLAQWGPLTLLVYRIGGAPWEWVPYAWHLADPEERPPSVALEGEPVAEPLLIVLVDSETGIVEGLRLVQPDLPFMSTLRHAVLGQALGEIAPDAHNRALAELAMHPEPIPALLEATRAWWIGEAEMR